MTRISGKRSAFSGTSGIQLAIRILAVIIFTGIVVSPPAEVGATTPPTVTTGAATNNTTGNSATLNGTLASLGTAATVNVFFEFGTTAGYGSSTTPQAKTAEGTFSTTITGLLPSTLYHFRARADGGISGVVVGDDMTFVTLQPVPPVVSTLSAVGISSDTASLVGHLDSLGEATTVYISFEYGTTTDYGSTTGVQATTKAVAFSASITGLLPETTYHFRARADGGVFGTAAGADMLFSTMPNGGGEPAFAGPEPASLFADIPQATTLKPVGFSTDSAEPRVNSEGVVLQTATLKSADDQATIVLPEGARLLDAGGGPLTSIGLVKPDTLPQPPPDNVIVAGYDFGPDGATFDPPITVKLKFNPADLPEGTALADLKVAFWDGSMWQIINASEVDLQANEVSAMVSHFTNYAVMGARPTLPEGGAPVPLDPDPPPMNVPGDEANRLADSLILKTIPTSTATPTPGSGLVSVANTTPMVEGLPVPAPAPTTFTSLPEPTADSDPALDSAHTRPQVTETRYEPAPDSVSALEAAFVVGEISISPGRINAGERATISIAVANNGGKTGTYTVVLTVNGVEEVRKELTLDASASRVEQFTLSRRAAGTYEVAANGLAASLVVQGQGLSRRLLVITVPVAVVLVGLAAYLIARRRNPRLRLPA